MKLVFKGGLNYTNMLACCSTYAFVCAKNRFAHDAAQVKIPMNSKRKPTETFFMEIPFKALLSFRNRDLSD